MDPVHCDTTMVINGVTSKVTTVVIMVRILMAPFGTNLGPPSSGDKESHVRPSRHPTTLLLMSAAMSHGVYQWQPPYIDSWHAAKRP